MKKTIFTLIFVLLLTIVPATLSAADNKTLWSFDENNEGFNKTSNSVTTEVKDGVLAIKMNGSDPYVYNDELNISIGTRSKIYITYKNEASYSDMQIRFSTTPSKKFASNDYVNVTVKKNMTEFETLEIDMSKEPGWTGILTALRIDPVSSTKTEEVFYLDSIEIPYESGTLFFEDGIPTKTSEYANSVECIVAGTKNTLMLVDVDCHTGKLLQIATSNPGEDTVAIGNVSTRSLVKLYELGGTSSLSVLTEPKVVLDRSTDPAVTVAKVFTDGMVLQRDRGAQVWGWSNQPDGTAVNVSLSGGATATGIVEDGFWLARLPEMSANTKGQTMTVSCAGTNVSFNDVLIGDVYFVDGQSNTDYHFYRSSEYAQDLPSANVPTIRFFYQNRNDAYGLDEQERLTIEQTRPVNPNYKWEQASTSTVDKISTIGYYFAKFITEAVPEVPVGLIQVSSDGATLIDLSPAVVNAESSGVPNASGNIQSYMYNTLMSPVDRYTARGMVWYQGESDSHWDSTINTYPVRLERFLTYIEGRCGSNLDLFYVQLSSHNYPNWKLGMFRSMQFNMQAEDYLMATSIDVGTYMDDADQAHPSRKKEVGRRLANLALWHVYDVLTEDEAKGPTPIDYIYGDFGVTIKFANVGDGLKLAEGSGSELLGFELIVDGKAIPAKAEITGADTVYVSADNIQFPMGVRYAYYLNASKLAANLRDDDGLPCPTFADGERADKIDAISDGVAEYKPQ